MSSAHRFLARSVVLILFFGMLPALQSTQVVAQDTGSYTAVKYDCPPGYDPGSGDANAAFSNCTTPAGGVSFTLQSGDGSYGGGTQQTNGSGSVSWNGIPLGVGYAVSETVPQGYGTPWVYCEVTGDPNNPGDVQRSYFAANGGNMDVGYTAPQLTSYTQTTCYWFNSPPAQNGQTQQYQGGGTAIVKIQKFLCDDSSYDYDSFTVGDYFDNCPDFHNGVKFSVNGGSQTATGNGNGTVEFGSLGAGQVDIRLHEVSGYLPKAVYCVEFPNGGSAANIDESNKQPLADEGNGTYRLSHTMVDGYTYYCYWFDYVETHPNVHIYKYYCDPSFDWQSGGYDYLLSGCTTPQSGVYFEVHNGGYSQGQSTDSSGHAWWSDVPSGNLGMVEQPPSGYQVGRIFCGVAAQNDATLPSSWQEYSYSDGWNVDLPEGQYLHCYVFDVPSDYGTIYLYKFYCDPSFDWQSGGYDYLLSGCTTPHEGVYFEVHNGSYSEGQTTDSGGTAAWSNVPGGTLDIVEQTPSGYTVGRVFCGYSSDGSTLPSSWDEYTYNQGIQVDLQSGQYLFCVYFNIPSEYGTVYLYKYYCDPEFDWQSGGYDYLLSGCTNPQPGVPFQVASGSYSQSQSTDSSGAATWTGVPSGDLGFFEDAPDGYTVGRIFCGYSDTQGTPPSSWDEYSYSGGWSVPYDSGQYLYCYVFDVPYNYGTVYFYKYYCDPDFDWQSNGYDYLLSSCTTPHEGVYFETYSGSYTQGQTTDSSGMATWTDVPWGDLSFWEDVPDGYQVGRIFCGYSDTDGTLPTSWDEYSYSDGWNVPTPPGKYLYCYIFDVPYDYGTVYIYKYYCEPGYEWSSSSYDDLYAECTSWQPDVYFEIHNGGYSQGQTTDSSGAATWEDVPGGDLEIVETAPDGYKVGKVFCGVTAQNSGTLPSSWTEYPYSDSWHVDMPEGEYVHCFVFDVPYDYGKIYFYKYYCAPEFDWESNGYDYLLSSCTTPHENVYFETYSGSYTQGQTTDSSGMATWTDVPWGPLSFYEEVPDGYQVGRIFCGYSDTDGTLPTSWDEYSYSDGWDVPTPPGKYLYCYIFDVPYEYGTVYFYKYYCAPEFDWENGGYDYLLSGCTTPHENVYFETYSGSYTQGQTTDTSGAATWTDVPWGDLSFWEDVPDGYQVGRIFCGYSDTDGVPPTSWDEYSYFDGWDVPKPPGKYLYCYIFDVPYDYGTIYIYKYYCEPDFDWQGGGYDYLYAECTSPHENVYFEVHNGGYSQGQTTDSSGAATWSDVPLGDLQIVEDIPDGYLVGRVYCGYSDQDGVPPTSWDEYDYFNGYNVSIEEGEYLYCYIFDVPYDYGTVYIYKYYCEPGFDWYDGSYDYLYSECTSWQPDVYFEIQSGGYSSGKTTDSSGAASWEDVPAGSLTIYEQPPDGYQVGKIFCGVVAQNAGTLPSSWDEYDYTDGWHVDLPEGQYLHCFVFDVPTEYGWVTIWKYTCPQDFDYGSSDLSYYESSCTERPEGVEFDLYNQPYGYEESQSTDASGEASWSDVPSGGDLYFWEVPNGYTPIAVYCGFSSDGSEPSTWDEYFLDSDGALSGIWVEPNQYLYCKWFNKPYDYPQVWIYKYNCDQTAHWNWSYHQLLAQCTTPGPGVEYGWGPQGESPSSSTMDDQGKWLYEDLQPGVWYWTETYPSGYSGAVVYCQWVGPYGSGDYQKADLDGSTLWLEVDWGQVITCYWFDFPTGYEPPSSGGSSGSGGSGSSGGSGTSGGTSGGGTAGGGTSGGGTAGGGTSGGGGSAGGGAAGGGTGGPPPLTSNAPTGPKPGGPVGGGTTSQQGSPNAPVTLIIVKHTCPEGFDLYGEDADVEQDCTDLTGEIDYSLTDLSTADADPVDQTTGDDGKATWTNLKAGPYLIVESLPDDTYSAFIWTCKSDKRQFQLQYPFTPFSYAGPNGEIGITLIAGEKLECAWYDVPSAPVEVTVLKFECPSSPVIVAQCTPAGAGVNFNLTPAGGAVGAIIQMTTDANGSATGSGVAGPYTLAEQGGTPCLIDSESLDQQGHVVLEPGDPTEIRVYNCGGGGS